MKLIAIRVASFRRFAQPAAVEGFGEGVNVLAGPNEMGKSTLFHALEVAFLTRSKVTGAALDLMRPHAGGDPLVEAEFEAQGRHWLIRKQFGRGAAAFLTDVPSNQIVARNAEAEERLAALIGSAGNSAGSIGLVWVEQQRSLQPPDPDMKDGKEKIRGERAVLRNLIGREIAAAAAGGAFESVRALVKSALDELLTPSRNGARKNGPLERALATRKEAQIKRDEARSAATAAEQRLTRIATMAKQLNELQRGDDSQVLVSRISELERRFTEAGEARARRELAREKMKTFEAQLDAMNQALVSHQKLLRAIEAKRATQAVAQELSQRIEVLNAELAADFATPETVAQLSTLDRERSLADAELAGHTASVDIRLEESGKGKVSVAGEPVVESRRFAVVEPLRIDIESIGAITVSTAQAVRGAELKAKSASASEQMQTILRQLGVGTLAEAHERAATCAAKAAKLKESRIRLSEIAPGGLPLLANDLAELEAALAESDRKAVTGEEVASLKSQAVEARDNFDALSARSMPDDAFQALQSKLEETRRTSAQRQEKMRRLALDLEREKGEQIGVDETGRASEVAASEGEFERASEDAARLEHEARALLLLDSTLAGIEASAKAAYFEPISRRLRPSLERVFGSAALTFKDEFALDAFERDGVREDVARLSDGTREQLSILVRLAFADVLGHGGNPVPLVLDDPLVYSDDTRLAAVCSELAAAKGVSQVILLTCREKAFSVLPGRRLSITQWRPEQA